MIIKILLIILLIGASYIAYDIFTESDTKKLNLTERQKEHYSSLMDKRGVPIEVKSDIKEKVFGEPVKNNIKHEIQLLDLNKNIAIKVEKIYINSINNLIVDMKFGNKLNTDYKERTKIECVAFLNLKELERFKWNKYIEIAPKKAILIKGMDFGKVASKQVDDIKCRTLL